MGRRKKHSQRLLPMLGLALSALLASSGCHEVAGFGNLPASADGGADVENFDKDAAADAGDAGADAAPAFLVLGEPVPLDEGHSPVITIQDEGYVVAYIGPREVRALEFGRDANDSITRHVLASHHARTPAITSTAAGLFIAWAQEDDSGDAIGLQVSRDFGDPDALSAGRHDSPRFFTTGGDLHLLASVHTRSDPCVTHTKMLQASFDGSQWGSASTVYPPQNGWSAFFPLPVACPETCAPLSHGLLWLHSDDADDADGDATASRLQTDSKITLRFTPVPLPQAGQDLISDGSAHTELTSAHPYDCQSPHLPRRRPTALHSDGKIFVAYSDWDSGIAQRDTAQTGVHLATLTPPTEKGDALEARTLLAQSASAFPQLLLLEGSDLPRRLLIAVRQEGESHTIVARSFDERGALRGDEMRLHTLKDGFVVESLDAAVLGEGEVGLVFSQENTLAGASTPQRSVHFFQVRFDPAQL